MLELYAPSAFGHCMMPLHSALNAKASWYTNGMKPLVNELQLAPLRALPKVAFLALFILACTLTLSSCGTSSTAFQPAYQSPYNWAGLEYSGDRLAYFENDTLASQQGIDVSSHQGVIDWNAVSNDAIDFAIVRVGNRGYTKGELYVDEYFIENIDGATAAGLDVGTYFFSQALNEQEAREEADFVLKQLNGRPLSLPVVFDHEPVADASGRANNISGEALAACARVFCERIEAAGYQTMIYGNKQDIARFAGSSFGERPVWFAEYEAATPSGQFDFVMWQYSNSGMVAGINAAVDMNILFTVK